jgi:hypothetical protein
MTTENVHEAPSGANRPRAVAVGELWGRVDCYILSTGERIISQRGHLRAFRGHTNGPEKGDLGRYLARLPARFSTFSNGPKIEFDAPLPQGGYVTAVGRSPEFFVGTLRAYVEAREAGELHPKQLPIAKRALDLLCLLAGHAIEAMIDAACGRLPPRTGQLPIGEEQERARLEAENALLRAKADLLDPSGPGVIGKPRASVYIQIPLREAARRFSSAMDDYTEAGFRREFEDLEGQVRLHIGFPKTLGAGRWENLSILLFGKAREKVIEIAERAKRITRRGPVSTQASFPEVGA